MITGPTNAEPLTPARAQTQAQAGKGSFTAGADFNMFLRMLTTQMQNQNPLNPTEASDFAVQLATFSSVEQQIQTNQLLSRLNDQILAADLANWLEREIATDGPVRFTSGLLEFHAAPQANSSRRELVVLSLAGDELARLQVPTQDESFRIDPASVLPGAMPGMSYRVEIVDFSGADVISRQNALHYQQVREVRSTGDGAALLVLADGTGLSPADVRAVRAGNSSGMAP